MTNLINNKKLIKDSIENKKNIILFDHFDW